MTLNVGTQLGPYEVTALLGAGGMGEVYRARDSRLKRDVAIKILPDSFLGDPERLGRFQREAEVLASLNHPNIAAIYGLEDSKDQKFLVMELVPGETLAAKIARGAIPLNETLVIAKQIAEALEAAHDKGIIHRDLKPANINITGDGTAKVLDFGLAKTYERTASQTVLSNSPTMASLAATNAGVIFGTAAYMSPEQAAGKPVDRRADIWSFGVVIWEMITGTRLFDGETISHTLAGVLRSPIDFDKLPANTPRSVRDLLRRCLDRNVRNRLRDIGEARILLENPAGVAENASAGLGSPDRPVRNRALWAVTAVLALGLAASSFGWWRSTRPVDRPLMQLSVDLRPDAVAALNTTAVLSRDGARIVFPIRGPNGLTQLATRTLDQPKATIMSGTEGGSDPFFSPDGQWIGFFADGKLKKVAVQGGAPVTLCDAGGPRGGSWGDDGNIIFTPETDSHLMRVSSTGGTPQPLTKSGNVEHVGRWPQVLPGGKSALFTQNANPFSWEEADISLISLDTGQIKTVLHGGYYGRYLPSPNGAGHLCTSTRVLCLQSGLTLTVLRRSARRRLF